MLCIPFGFSTYCYCTLTTIIIYVTNTVYGVFMDFTSVGYVCIGLSIILHWFVFVTAVYNMHIEVVMHVCLKVSVVSVAG
jgi:hypothetical protein